MSRRLQDLLSLQADRRADSRALLFNGCQMTYGELELASNRLARTLKASGCARGDRVMLLLPKSIEAIVAMFAALKADCIYVPLDTASPAVRLARIVEVCKSRFVLATSSTSALLNEIRHSGVSDELRVGWMDGGATLRCGMKAAFYWGNVLQMSPSAVDSQNSDDNAAHILFTSGSTGLPKGVVITHSNILQFVDWAVLYFGMGPSDRISGQPPLHFDLSMLDIYGSIAAGAQLHLVPPHLSILPHALAAFIRAGALTQWFSVPSLLHYMAKLDVVRQNDFPSLRRLLWCGEKFPAPALIYWMRRVPHARFFNLYGPTETTIASSCYQVQHCPESETAEIPIGSPCNGEQLLVLDDQLCPVPAGQTGDLYIAGVGLSPGYWNDPTKTREVFLPATTGLVPSGRIYKTGDLARIGNDGELYLVGRSDSQIKSRGYRIELGEIEAALHTIAGVEDAAVVSIGADGFEGATICCAYVPSAGSGLSTLSVKKQLSGVLPAYMLPSHWMILDRMPRNGNGKVDRPTIKEQFRRQELSPTSVVSDQRPKEALGAA